MRHGYQAMTGLWTVVTTSGVLPHRLVVEQISNRNIEHTWYLLSNTLLSQGSQAWTD